MRDEIKNHCVIQHRKIWASVEINILSLNLRKLYTFEGHEQNQCISSKKHSIPGNL